MSKSDILRIPGQLKDQLPFARSQLPCMVTKLRRKLKHQNALRKRETSGTKTKTTRKARIARRFTPKHRAVQCQYLRFRQDRHSCRSKPCRTRKRCRTRRRSRTRMSNRHARIQQGVGPQLEMDTLNLATIWRQSGDNLATIWRQLSVSIAILARCIRWMHLISGC